nr:TonB-dependent siderophore receptor [Brevundimonas lenta]
MAQDATPSELEEIVVTGSQVELRPAYPGGQVATGGRVGMFGALDIMDTPFSTTAFTEELARNQQARSVADILQNDPVVRVAKGFGNFQELYVIRGFPVFSDDMTYNGVYGILPRQYVAAELLERVEVFHGATAFLNGAAPGGSGVGGAFNLVPKRAGDLPLTRATAGFEPEGQFYGALDVSRRFGEGDDFGVRANLARRFGEGAIDAQEVDLQVAALGLDYSGDNLRFSADAGYQDNHIDSPRPQVTPLGDVPTPPSASGNFAQPWTYTDEQQLFGVVRGEYDFSNDVTAWAAVGARNGEEANVLANPTAAADGSTTAYRFDNAREDTVVSADVGVRAEIDTGSVSHRIVASGAILQSKSRNAYAFSSFFAPFSSDLYNPVNVAPPVPDFFVGGSMSNPHVTERVQNSSLALADMVEFMDGKLIAIIGGRYQEIETKSYDYNSGAFLSGYEGDAFTPAIGLVYKPTDQISIYGNYAEALIPGATAPAVSGGVPVINAGEVLSPFRGEQIEAGVKYDSGRFGATVSLFRITLPSAFVENNVFAANGEQRNQGLEASVYGEPADGLRVLGGFTILDAEMTSTVGGALDGRTPIGVPDFQGNVNVEWDVSGVQGLTLEGRAVYTGEQWVNATNTVELEDWTRFDLGVRYSFEPTEGGPIVLRARVENVADEDHWASVGGYPGANYLVLGSPRTFVMSASVDF